MPLEQISNLAAGFAIILISPLLLVAIATIALFWWKPAETFFVAVVFWIVHSILISNGDQPAEAVGTAIFWGFLAAIFVVLFDKFIKPADKHSPKIESPLPTKEEKPFDRHNIPNEPTTINRRHRNVPVAYERRRNKP